MSVKVVTKSFSNGIGYELQIVKCDASLQDYLEALNKHILKASMTRTRQKTEQCEGCDNCCSERIPLTNIDLYALQQGLRAQGEERTLIEVLRRYAYVKAEGNVVDITLARNEAGSCIFLDQVQRKCRIYPFRPLVCQTYICCPTSPHAEALRARIVNLGEDQLVKWCLTNIPADRLFNEAWEPEISLEDYQDTPFKDQLTYATIPLSKICQPKLWQALFTDHDDF